MRESEQPNAPGEAAQLRTHTQSGPVGSASGRTEVVIDSTVIKSRIRTLEFQLRVLKARIGRADDESFASSRSFAELYGVLRGKADSTDEEINAILFRAGK